MALWARNSPSVENDLEGDGELHRSNVGCLWQLVASWNDLFVNHLIPVFSFKSGQQSNILMFEITH